MQQQLTNKEIAELKTLRNHELGMVVDVTRNREQPWKTDLHSKNGRFVASKANRLLKKRIKKCLQYRKASGNRKGLGKYIVPVLTILTGVNLFDSLQFRSDCMLDAFTEISIPRRVALYLHETGDTRTLEEISPKEKDNIRRGWEYALEFLIEAKVLVRAEDHRFGFNQLFAFVHNNYETRCELLMSAGIDKRHDEIVKALFPDIYKQVNPKVEDRFFFGYAAKQDTLAINEKKNTLSAMKLQKKSFDDHIERATGVRLAKTKNSLLEDLNSPVSVFHTDTGELTSLNSTCDGNENVINFVKAAYRKINNDFVMVYREKVALEQEPRRVEWQKAMAVYLEGEQAAWLAKHAKKQKRVAKGKAAKAWKAANKQNDVDVKAKEILDIKIKLSCAEAKLNEMAARYERNQAKKNKLYAEIDDCKEALARFETKEPVKADDGLLPPQPPPFEGETLPEYIARMESLARCEATITRKPPEKSEKIEHGVKLADIIPLFPDKHNADDRDLSFGRRHRTQCKTNCRTRSAISAT